MSGRSLFCVRVASIPLTHTARETMKQRAVCSTSFLLRSGASGVDSTRVLRNEIDGSVDSIRHMLRRDKRRRRRRTDPIADFDSFFFLRHLRSSLTCLRTMIIMIIYNTPLLSLSLSFARCCVPMTPHARTLCIHVAQSQRDERLCCHWRRQNRVVITRFPLA